jgi:hypothetical protein
VASTQDLLNKVLIGLRKDTIATTSVTSAYHLLLLQFLNTAKEEVENAWDWQALRTTITQAVVQGTTSYTLSGVTPRSRLLYERPAYDGTCETSLRVNGALPQVFDVTDTTEYRLMEMTPERVERLHFLDNDEQALPTSFALVRTATGVTLRLYPTPSSARTLKLRFVVPQDDLGSTAITSNSLSVPATPVWLRALELANEERGEEIGQAEGSLIGRAQLALYNAIAAERTDADDTGFPE